MAKTIGPVKIKQYSLEFKLKAVQLSITRHAARMRPDIRTSLMKRRRGDANQLGRSTAPRTRW